MAGRVAILQAPHGLAFRPGQRQFVRAETVSACG
jgi:hypothetical protein